MRDIQIEVTPKVSIGPIGLVWDSERVVWVIPHEKLVRENQELREKLTAVTTEYNRMLKEFGQQFEIAGRAFKQWMEAHTPIAEIVAEQDECEDECQKEVEDFEESFLRAEEDFYRSI